MEVLLHAALQALPTSPYWTRTTMHRSSATRCQAESC
ncbi:hypothetical protein MHYP_G00193800 [Metynnis hypsauchen]